MSSQVPFFLVFAVGCMSAIDGKNTVTWLAQTAHAQGAFESLRRRYFFERSWFSPFIQMFSIYKDECGGSWISAGFLKGFEGFWKVF